MALGVLNNLSAIYAENNLNNTNNSLQTVLEQLSSGSRINSGADDAAGLSLVNGLAANSAALTQSETNATEGVGLLQVADGALSQVTSLLDRAITLATEASNGTLNSTQESAANQEYQSILSEVNNIGQTTTYNQEQVFNGAQVAIYTGDSSQAGSSSDDLNIRSLSESSVGDTGGKMSYSSGANSVFVNLSTATQNAKATDSLNTTGTSTIDVNYLLKSNGSENTATTTISVGGATGYANTANGLISAINNAGLGMTASFTTQANAGVTGGGTQTGIEITGNLVSAGVDPSSVSTSGVMDPTGIPASELLTYGQTVTIDQGGTVAIVVPINQSINTLSELVSAINTGVGTSTYTPNLITASVITNGDGTQSLSLTNYAPGDGALSVTTAQGAVASPPGFSTPTTAVNAPPLTALGTPAPVTGTAATPPTQSSVTFGVAGTGNLGSDALSVGGSVTITNSATATSLNFIVGSGLNVAGVTYYTQNTGGGTQYANTLTGLAQLIQAENIPLDANAAVSTTGPDAGMGITVTAKNALSTENLSAVMGAVPLTNANATINLYNPTDGGAPTTGTPTVTVLDDTGGGALSQDDVFTTGTQLQLTNALGTVTFTAAAGQTFADLALKINGSALGVNAVWNANAGGAGNGGLVLTSNVTGVNPITVGTHTLSDVTNAGKVIQSDGGAALDAPGTAGAPGTYGTAVLQLATGAIGANGNDLTNVGGSNVDLTGQINIKNGAGATQTFIMGVNPGGPPPAGTIYTGANTVASLVTAINNDLALGITAVAPGLAANPGSGGIYLQSQVVGTTITTPVVPAANTLADAAAMPVGTPVLGVTPVTGSDSSVTVGWLAGGLNTNDVMTGNISITNGGITHTFSIGPDVTGNTVLPAGTTLAQLAAAIQGVGALGLTALANTSGLALTSANPQGTAILINSTSLADYSMGNFSNMTLGSFASENDTVSGNINFALNGVPVNIPVPAGDTIAQMIDKINGTTTTLGVTSTTYANGVTATWVPGANGYGNVEIASNTKGSLGQIASQVTSISDTTTTAKLSYTAANPYNTGLSNSASTAVLYDSTTNQSVSTFVDNTTGASGIATVSYSDGAGQSLSSTDLTNQSDAATALNDLNVAITDAAAQDGYIGAQINTLNSISQVMSTQQENVVSAQNAIQATDYASATSNMSKYEILSQTGIAALAQANSVEQEVTKLLQ
jgi:flagellin